MFTLIKNIEIYSPKYLGIKDILICNNKIIQISENIDFNFENLKVIDGTNKKAIPGIIDQHIHLLGGGGEGGYRTRVPEVQLSELIKSGVTTVVGLLGTDCITRNIESLVAKTKSLKEDGITAYCLTGGYDFPSPTVTGYVKKDILMIEEIIGVKLALSDHRSSAVTENELEKLALEARLGGMLSKKPGIITLHMGDALSGLSSVLNILKKQEIPITNFRPTHVSRNERLFKESIEFNRLGGYIDLTAEKTTKYFEILKKENALFDKITLSSDGNGSWSNYDDFGNLLEIGAASCDGIFKQIVALVKNNIFSLEEALSFGTENVAKALNISNFKGSIKENFSADILILKDDFQIETVISNGNLLMENQNILKYGFFEKK